jgi:ring-1,2-phenylacetyl-CoA epoxidase subunit PaaD
MTTDQINKEAVYKYLERVNDPEVPVLNVIDLGIIREVILPNEGEIEVVITPTYSGCPAMDVITMNIRIALSMWGFKKIKITQALSPAWTTDWMSEAGKQKLKDYGIAPPHA